MKKKAPIKWTDSERRLLQQGINDGLSNEQIGEILGRTTVAVQVFKSKNKFRKTVVQQDAVQLAPAAKSNAALQKTLMLAAITIAVVALIIVIN